MSTFTKLLTNLAGKEDTPLALVFSTVKGYTDASADTLSFKITSLPANGKLSYGASATTLTDLTTLTGKNVYFNASGVYIYDTGTSTGTQYAKLYWTSNRDSSGLLSTFSAQASASATSDLNLSLTTPVVFKINATAVNDAPTLGAISTLDIAATNTLPVEITYNDILGKATGIAADPTSLTALKSDGTTTTTLDVDGNAVSFVIQEVTSAGTLYKWNNTNLVWELVVSSTGTTIGIGEKLQWTPTVGVTGENAVSAFTVIAKDSAATPLTSLQGNIPVKLNVAPAPVVNQPPSITDVAATAITIDDTATAQLFSDVTITDADSNVTVKIYLDMASKGVLTGGFTADGNGIYSFTGTPTAATTAIQALTFKPNENRLPVGQTETTTFVITVDDGVAAIVSNNQTTVTATSVNSTPVLVTNSPFAVNEGGEVTLTAGNLAATDGDGDTVTFHVSSLVGGSFRNATGSSISSFTATQLAAGGVKFVHDGSETVPSFQISVGDEIATTMPVTGATIAYTPVNDQLPVLTTKTLTISQGAAVTLSSANFAATDADKDASGNAADTLTFNITNLTGGTFKVIATGATVTSFTAVQVSAGAIQFVHDGTFNPPAFSVAVSDGVHSSNVASATINYQANNVAPVLTTNALTISEGGTVVLSSSNFAATDGNGDAVTFIVSEVVGGAFKVSGSTVTQFTSTQLAAGAVSFVHDGGETPASFKTAVSDGSATTQAVAATVTYTAVNDAPTGAVTITGNLAQGAQLTANTTALADAEGLGVLSYQWKAGGVDINGATVSTYTLTQNEVNKAISVTVSYTDVKGAAESVTSVATATVGNFDDPATGGTVAITGTVQEGGALTANLTGATDPDGAITTAYQWQISDNGTDGWANLGGANSSNYTIASDESQVGKHIRVIATTTDALGGTTDFASVSQQVSGVNDAPIATNLNATEAFSEDPVLPVNFTDVVITDVDSATLTATLTLSDEFAGVISTATSGAVTSTFSGGVWMATGAIADVNTLLAGATFTPTADYDQNFTIATSVSDGVAAPITSIKNVTVTPVNDAPAIDGDTTGTTTGTLSITDPDTGESSFIAQTNAATTYGSVSVTTAGVWTFTPNATHPIVSKLPTGATITDTFSVVSFDETVTTPVTVTIMGAYAGTLTVQESEAVQAVADLTNSAIYNISDSATALAAANDTILGKAKIGTVAANTNATALQAVTLAGFEKTVVYSITDTPTNLLLPANAAVISGATAVAVTDGAAGDMDIQTYTALLAATTVDTWTYSITDTPTNLLLPANAAVISGATAVAVTDGAAGDMDIQTYTALLAATTVDTWTYSITDTPTNLLLPANAAVISGATAVAVTDGAAGDMDIQTYTALLAATTVDTWTYSITDTPTNLLLPANAAVISGATAVAVTDGAAGDMDIQTYTALLAATTVDTWTYSITDTPTNLLLPANAAVISGATAVAVTDGAAGDMDIQTYTALLAATTVDTWTYSITDTPTNLLLPANAAVISGATAVAVTDGAAGDMDIQTYTALLAATTVDTWTYSITDTPTNLLLPANAAVISGATAVAVTDGAAGDMDIQTYTALLAATTVDTWTYSITDTPTNLLLPANAAVISGATAVAVTDGAAGDMDIQTYTALLAATTVDTWTYSITDTPTNLLLPANAAVISGATAVAVTDGAAGDMDIQTYTALLAATTVDTWTYSITDTPTNLLLPANAAVISGATAVAVTDGAAGDMDIQTYTALLAATTVDTWTYSITDTPTNLLLPANAAVISGATAVAVTDGAAGDMDIQTYTALLAVTTVDTWTYSITDTPTNLLLPANAAVISGATAVAVTDGAAGDMDIQTYTALLAATTVDTWTYSITDTPTNLLLPANAAVISGATAVAVTDGAAGDMDIQTYTALLAATTVDTWTYSITDTPTNLLLPANAAVISGATAVAVTDGAAGDMDIQTYTALLAATTVDTWTYSITDTPTNLLLPANAAVISGATAVAVTDGAAGDMDIQTYTALLAATTVDTWTYSITDTPTNLLLPANAAVISGATAVAVTDGAAGDMDIQTYTALLAATTVDTWTYSITDTPTNLLLPANAAVISGATAVAVTDGAAGDMDIQTYTALLAATTVDTWTYSITDTPTNLLLPANAAVISGATAVAVTDGAAGDMDIQTYTALLAATTVDTWTYSITDTPTNLLLPANAAVISGATAVAVTDGAAGDMNIQTYTALLAATTVDTWTYSITDTPTNLLLPANAAVISGATAVAVTDGAAGDMDIQTYTALLAATTVDTWTYSITDTPTNLLLPANAAVISGATAVAVTDGDAGDMDIQTYTALLAATTVDTWTYSITDTPTNLLLPANAAVISGATAVAVTDGAAGDMDIQTRADLLAVTTVDTWTYSITDTPTNLLLPANAAVISGATAVAVTDGAAGDMDIQTYTALLAATTVDTWTYSITDTPTNLLLPANAAVISGATAVAVTDGAAGDMDIQTYTALLAATTVDTWTYSITDTPTNLLLPANAAVISGATAVAVTDGAAGDMDIQTYTALLAATTVDTWTYSITDTPTNLLLPANAAVISGATAVAVTDGAAGDMDIQTYTALLAATTVDTWTYSIIDTPTNLLLPANAAVISGATAVAVTDGAAGDMDIQTYTALLAATTEDTWTYSISDTTLAYFGEDNVLDANVAAVTNATAITITGDINIAQAQAIFDARGDLDEVTYTISDTAAAIMTSPDLIANATNITIAEDEAWAADWKVNYTFTENQSMTSTDVAIIGTGITADDMKLAASTTDSGTPANSNVVITYNNGSDHTLTVTETDMLSGTELVFEDGSLVKVGNGSANTILGSNITSITSGDFLSGQGGNDVIRGLSGTDKLLGGLGSDILYGGQGSDNLYGDAGNDLLYGGDSSANDSAIDTFNYTKSTGGGEGSDMIVGFNPNQDIIHFAGGTGIGTDVTVTASGSNTLVTLANSSGTTKITLIGVVSTDVTAADFTFA